MAYYKPISHRLTISVAIASPKVKVIWAASSLCMAIHQSLF